jgi:hypothetical protein
MHELLADISSLLQQPDGFRPGTGLISLIMAGFGTLILNAVVGTSDAAKMIGNFCVLLAGAMVAMMLVGMLRLPGDAMMLATFASAAGMTFASISTMAIFRPA